MFRLAKGFLGRSKNCYRVMIHRVHKALKNQYVSRRLKKRDVRTQWIMQMGAAAREHDIGYGRLIHGMHLANIGLNRKVMAQLAQQEPYSFRAVVDLSKQALQDLGKPQQPPSPKLNREDQILYKLGLLPAKRADAFEGAEADQKADGKRLFASKSARGAADDVEEMSAGLGAMGLGEGGASQSSRSDS